MQRFLSAAFAAFAFTAPAIAAVPVGGPQPLVDRNLIRSSAGLHRVIGAPVKAAAPIVDGASDHNHTPYLSVIHENGRFRLWYAAKLSDSELRLGYTTSADGIRFGARRMLPLPAGYQWGRSSAARGATSCRTRRSRSKTGRMTGKAWASPGRATGSPGRPRTRCRCFSREMSA